MEPVKKTILVVEDDPTMNKTLKEKLASSGFNVVTAFDGEEALGVFRKNQVDMILLDIMMPKVDGQTFVHMLNPQEKKDLPIIVLTNLNEFVAQDYIKEVIVKSNTSIDEIVSKVQRYF